MPSTKPAEVEQILEILGKVTVAILSRYSHLLIDNQQ